MSKFILCCSFFVASLLFVSCFPSSEQATKTIPLPKSTFVDSAYFDFAKHIEIAEYSNYFIIKTGTQLEHEYIVVSDSYKLPDSLSSYTRIPYPVKNIACMSTTQVGLIEFIGLANKIAGIANSKYVYSDVIQQRIKEDLITNLDQQDLESWIKADIDLVLLSDPQAAFQEKLQALGIASLIMPEYLESHPLGRAEWHVIFDYLTDDYSNNRQNWAEVISLYELLAKKASEIKTKPSVMTGLPYKGTWYMPGGDGYLAQLIEDAGGNYIYSKSQGTKSMSLDLEAVINTCDTAQFWINPGTATSLQEIQAADSRLANLRPFQDSLIYNASKRQSASGGYDLYESGVARPDLLLQDLIKFLHFNDDRLQYFERLN